MTEKEPLLDWQNEEQTLADLKERLKLLREGKAQRWDTTEEEYEQFVIPIVEAHEEAEQAQKKEWAKRLRKIRGYSEVYMIQEAERIADELEQKGAEVE